jgi:3-hydroxybutyryl-CoA dehydrogenase
MEIRAVGVIGLGTMGAGIAEVFARGGCSVTAVEADPQALARGLATLNGSLAKAVARGRLSQAEQEAIAARVRPAAKFADLADADLVVEVVPEQLPIKRQVLAELDEFCRPDAIIATNTSSLSVTSIAAASRHPGRVVGMHFFNPAPVMKLVEVVTTVLTDPPVGAAVTDLARTLGKTPVQVTDRAGFVANALLLPYLNHAVRLLETGYASREDIDAAAKAGMGLPMGPLTLLDLIGLDTSLAILEVLQREFGGTRCTPAPLLRRLVDAGRTGRKSGAGFYDYGSSSSSVPPPSPIILNEGQTSAPGTVRLITPVADQGAELTELLSAVGLRVTADETEPSDLTIVTIDCRSGVLDPAIAAGQAAQAVGLHLVGDGFAELVATPLTSPAALATAQALVAKLGLTAVRAPDQPGLLVGALRYPHLRDAVAMVADGYATPADVDAAMTLGCGYPRGPIAMLSDVGLAHTAEVLAAMHAAYGDPAYAPPPLLTAYARAGLELASYA